MSYNEQLDVAWAHQMQQVTGGAFTNPFEMREMMDELFYAVPPTIKKSTRPVTGQKGTSMKAPPLDAIRRMNELNAALRAQTAAAKAASPTLAPDG